MTHRASVNLHFDVDEIGHRYKRGSFATLDIIAASGEVETYLHFADSAMIDKAIAELVALKQEMDPPVITDSDRTCDQANPDTGAWCHRGGDHGVHRDTDGEEWRTDLRVTDDERTYSDEPAAVTA